MDSEDLPRQPTRAETLFVGWLADRARDFDSVVGAHLDDRDELRALHATWARLEPLLALAEIPVDHAVQRLIAPDDEASDPLDLPSSSVGSTATIELMRRLEQKRRTARYRFEGEVARGGMGAILRVWDEDIRRHLAMKVVLGQAEASPDGPPVDARTLARFLQEAQITGQLDHPGIVPVHELGLDADGRVYFTMKLVKGRNLAAIYKLVASRAEGWTDTRALGVLLKVCDAVAFAHAKGVIHRDLKPSNVMVGDFGEVYVMDWGLARVVSQEEAGKTGPKATDSGVHTELRHEREMSPDSSFMTLDGDVVGTPAYMSPEQARGDHDTLSERADVYALGAMLYHLLSGARPYSRAGENVDAKVIWKRVIAGPPQRLDRFERRAPTELVAICDKAMARDPADRYADMLALANDLRAFLEGRVVGAFEGGAIAEARKWVRRNKALAGSIGLAVLALVAGLVASLVLSERVKQGALLAEERRAQAEKSADEARRQALVAGEANRFLNEDLLAAVAPEALGIDVTVREVLDQASMRLEGRFADEPSVEAALRLTIGTSYQMLGEYAKARGHVERSLELRRAHQGPESQATIEAMQAVASTWNSLGLRTEAIGLYRETVAICERVLGSEHPETLVAQNNLAVALAESGEYEPAREIYDRILAIRGKVLPSDHPDVLTTLRNLSRVDQEDGRLEDALEKSRFILERSRETLGPKHPDTLTSMSRVASVLLDLGRLEECEDLYLEALEGSEEVNGPDHPTTGSLERNLGHVLSVRGLPNEALPHLMEGLRIARASQGDEHATTQGARAKLAFAFGELGRHEEALELDRQVLEVQRRVLPKDHPITLAAINSLGAGYLKLGDFAAAEPLFRETLDARRRISGADHPDTIVALENLSNVMYRQERYAECEPILREVLAARRRVLGDGHPAVARTTYNLGCLMDSIGDSAAALTLFVDAAQRARALGADAEPALVITCMKSLGDAYAVKKEYGPMIEAYRDGLAARRRIADDPDADSAYFAHQIGAGLYYLGDHTGAQAQLEGALMARETLVGPDAVPTRQSLRMLARTHLALDHFVECERAAVELMDRVQRTVGAEHEEARRARELLVELYERWGKPDEAAKWR